MKKQGQLSSPSLLSFLSFLTLALILALFATPAHSADVTLAWDPNSEPDLAGYKLYYKTESSGPPYDGTGAIEGDSPIDVGNVTEFTIHGLTDGVTYFFVVTAHDTEGLESDYSNEVNTLSPTIENYPTIDYANNTIDVTYSEYHMQNATDEANYEFSPSLNFATPLVDGDDITNISGTTYRLSMASIPAHTIFNLTVSNITDAEGNLVTPNSVRINDNDNDDMADDWETDYGVDVPDEDPDGDGLNTLQEYNNSTDPNSADTDRDCLLDGWEVTYGLDPLDSTGENGTDGDLDNDGWTNYEEYIAGTNPADSTSFPESSPPEIVETIPHHDAGLNEDTNRIPDDTSFCVWIEDSDGIDITDSGSISFTISDGAHEPFERDLSNETVRVVKLAGDEDTQVTKLWAVYDRCNDDEYGNSYAFDSIITIGVDVKDRRGIPIDPVPSYTFKIESEIQHHEAHDPDNLPDTSAVSPDDPDLEDPECVYNAGIQVNSGDLEGAKIIYNNNEPVIPRLGPTDEIPSLDGGCGGPMNLQPPTVFNTPAKILIPCPQGMDVSDLHVYLYKAGSWVHACDNKGELQPGGEAWMVHGSRVDHNDRSPSTIEIKIYHLSAAQAKPDTASSGPPQDSSASISANAMEVGGGCFIAATAFQSNINRAVNASSRPVDMASCCGHALVLLCGLILLLLTLVYRMRPPSRSLRKSDQ